MNLNIWLNSSLCFEKDRSIKSFQKCRLYFFFPFCFGEGEVGIEMPWREIQYTYHIYFLSGKAHWRKYNSFLSLLLQHKIVFSLYTIYVYFPDIQKFTSLWGKKKRNTLLPANVLLFKRKIGKWIYFPSTT